MTKPDERCIIKFNFGSMSKMPDDSLKCISLKEGEKKEEEEH